MNEVKEDIRIQKTKTALVTALFTLLEKNPFAKITVNDLCAQALISRSAFYSHFDDKYMLLRFSMEILRQKLFENSQGLPLEEALTHILLKIQNNAKLFKHLLMEDVEVEVLGILRRLFHQSFEETLIESALIPAAQTQPLEIASIYYASGLTSVIMLWLAKNMDYSASDLARYLTALILPKPPSA